MVPTRPESDVIVELQEQGEEIEILLRGDIIEPSLEDVYAPIEIAAEVNPEAPDNEFETIEVGISAEIVELRTEILGISADLALSTETFTYKGSEVYENNAVAEFIASVETQPEDVSTIEFHEITSNHNEPAQTVEKLAKYFIQEAKEAEPHIHEIVTILNDIEESLPDDNVEFTLDEVLNEVVVQKLVELFTELGHEKPLQAVKEYFEDYGIAEGLSILNYVANLARSFDAQEVSPVSKHVKDDINALIFALGSVLLRLTTNKTLESSV